MGVILGILQGADGEPCVEAPDSPAIDIGEPECLLSTDTDNPPSSEWFQNIRSVRVVEVKRTFTCFKKDFQTVRNWLASLDGGHLQYNAGLHGKAVIAGKFRLVGGISMNPTSATLGTVEAVWRGYVLDCNIDLADSIRFRQDTPTQWSILCGDTVVLTASSKTEGDGTGLIIVPGETVTWNNLPEDVKAKAPQYTVVEPFPTTPEQCESALTGSTWDDYSKKDPTKNWIIFVPEAKVFSAGPYAYYTKWRALRLTCNGEDVLTWWVQVSYTANSVDDSKAITIKRVYYSQAASEMVVDDGAIHGPIDLADSSNGRLAIDIHEEKIVAKYDGNGGEAELNVWAFRPSGQPSTIAGFPNAHADEDIVLFLTQEEMDDLVATFPDVVYQSPAPGSQFVFVDGYVKGSNRIPEMIHGLVMSTDHGNSWAFEAFPGDTGKSIRFTTPPGVYVSSVTVSPSGQVTIGVVSGSYLSVTNGRAGAGSASGHLDLSNEKIRAWWAKQITSTGQSMADIAAQNDQNVSAPALPRILAFLKGWIPPGIGPKVAIHYGPWFLDDESSNSGSDSSSSSLSQSASSAVPHLWLHPRAFMYIMEKRINEWLVSNGYLASADAANAFHYDHDWTSVDTMRTYEGSDIPDDAVMPVLSDEQALISSSGYIPKSGIILTNVPGPFRGVPLDKVTTNAEEGASFDECGVYSCPDSWSNGTDVITYKLVFREAWNYIISSHQNIQHGLTNQFPSAFGFYVPLVDLHYADQPDNAPLPIAAYAPIGYIFTAIDALQGESSAPDQDSIVRLFWREDDKTVALLANNGLGKNPLLTFKKTPDA